MYTPLPNSVAHFKIDGLFGFNVKGTISDLQGEIKFDETDLRSAIIGSALTVSLCCPILIKCNSTGKKFGLGQ